MKHLTSLAFLAALALQTRADDQRENNSLAIDPSRASSKAVSAPTVERDDPAMAVVELDIHPKLAANLFASEPMMTNPASIDVDDMGRVWVCEAINYRAFRNADVMEDHQEGDRIIVLEDSDRDAKADKKTVFYQGHDVDSAHGVMVMPARRGKGTKAIVSALDSVFFLIDDDGDLKADRKELLFTGIGGVQHDHGIHAFHFGPDGKLYFNFGNAGKQIKDQKGVPIIDKMGHEVNDSRNPYQEGMAFRCNLDGSEFETLAWNFRNNWEICVDSFGTIWQSDNDDDGNQGCRINYVMEYGNYGYKDELTGAAWTEPRTNWEKEIPQRHWHLNDPGVIPNLLQTGAVRPPAFASMKANCFPSISGEPSFTRMQGETYAARTWRRRTAPVTPQQLQTLLTESAISGSARVTRAWRRTARCSSPTGTIRALVVTAWRISVVVAFFASHHGARLRRITRRPRSTSRLPQAPSLHLSHRIWRPVISLGPRSIAWEKRQSPPSTACGTLTIRSSEPARCGP